MQTTTRIQPVSEGFIHRRRPSDPMPIAVGSRLANLGGGKLLCSFMLQSKVGVNDFTPVLCESNDDGKTWSEPRIVWPHLANKQSLFPSISRKPDHKGRLHLFGLMGKIDAPGESVWQEENHGLKKNDPIFAVSKDLGRTWSEPKVIPKPTPGSIEAPGAMAVTRDGGWIACYSPYNSFDKSVSVAHEQVVFLRSDDEGATWWSSQMLKFDNPDDGTAESWVTELTDGRLLGACWHMSYATSEDYPNPFALSSDGGRTWTAPRAIGIAGQTIALMPLPGGLAGVLYNQRRKDPAGVRLAIVQFDGNVPNIVADDLVWQAAVRKQREGGDLGLSDWTDFAYGEPAMVQLDNGDLLVAIWCIQPDGQGIRYVRVRID